jgi:tetratricopeptide (TPR) repeat protein
MSLLMDALKRAEKARQAQAEKPAEVKDVSPSELALDPIEADGPQAGQKSETPSEPQLAASTPQPQAAGPRSPEPERPSSSPAPDPATTHFSLSDDFPATEKVPPPETPEEQSEDEKLGPFSLVRDDELSLEDTGEMIPVVRQAEKTIQQFFDEPPAVLSSSPDSAGPDAEADSNAAAGPVAQDNDGHSKLAAEGVFKAKASSVTRYRRNRTLTIALSLLVLGVVAIGLPLFWDDLERTFFGAPPILVQRSPQAAELPPPPIAAEEVEASKLVVATEAASAGEPVVQGAPGSEVADSTRVATASAAPVLQNTSESSAAVTAAAGPVAKAAETAPVTGGFEDAAAELSAATLPMPRAEVPRPPLAAVGRPYAEAAASGIRISRRSNSDKVHEEVNRAYLAFQRGDDSAARALYSEVKRKHPDNRNAILGLGAIAVRGGDYADAVGHYAHLLSVDPRDPIARAALINLNQRVPAIEGESHVKRLLAEDPEQPFLYFTLGNLFARQGRWLEAQQAYFDAYRLDSNSADFAFNLAVSLDRLGQLDAALNYYRRALELAKNGVASFEARAAETRISRLKGGGPG